MRKALYLILVLILCAGLAAPVLAIDSAGGTCGENLTWTVNDGTLTISGTGAMENYGDDGERHVALTPWHIQLPEITSVVLEDGITGIGAAAFIYCTNLACVTIPDSVISIGKEAFYGCENLNDVYFGGSESQWKQIGISDDNNPLLNAAIHCSSTSPLPDTVMLSPQKLNVDGDDFDCEKYNINGNNFFRLRDLAYLLNGTGSRFRVDYDEETDTVAITTGAGYLPDGSELKAGADNSATARRSSQTILIDGVERGDLTVYNIGGSNFFQLRELGDALGFEVDYDAETDTAVVRRASEGLQLSLITV